MRDKIPTTYRANRAAQLCSLSKEAFRDHVLVESSRDRARIRRLGTSMYWVEILNLANGALLVHGDISPCIFAYGPDLFEERVKWVAKAPASYASQKYAIGTSVDRYDWDDDAAREDLLLWSKEAKDQGRSPRPFKEALRVQADGKYAMIQTLSEGVCMCEYSAIGQVIPARVYWAQAACVALLSLLEKEKSLR